MEAQAAAVEQAGDELRGAGEGGIEQGVGFSAGEHDGQAGGGLARRASMGVARGLWSTVFIEEEEGAKRPGFG